MKRSLSAYTTLLVLLLITGGLCSCHREQERKMTRHYSSHMYELADSIRNNGSPVAALLFVDSVYARIPEISVADKFDYYLFLSKLCDSRIMKPSGMCNGHYADSMLSLIETNGLTDAMWKEYVLALRKKQDYLIGHGAYNKAYELITQIKLIYAQHNDSFATQRYAYLLGEVLYQQGKYTEAAAYYKEALATTNAFTNGNTRLFQAQSQMSNIALCYTKAGQIDSAMKYFHMVLAYIKAHETTFRRMPVSIEMSLGVIYGNMGQAYRAGGDTAKALQLFHESIRINSRPGYENNDANITRMHLAGLYMDLKHYDSAYTQLKISGDFLETKKEPQMKLYWLQLMSAYAQVKDREHATSYLQQYYVLKDSLQTYRQQLNSTDIRLALDKAEQQYKTDLLKKNNYIQRLYLFISFAAGILLAAVLITIWLALRNSKKMVAEMSVLNHELSDRQQQLERAIAALDRSKEQKRKEDLLLQKLKLETEHRDNIAAQRRQISDDMHDDLSTSLVALQYFIGDMKEKSGTGSAQDILSKVESEIATIYKNVRAYMHNLNTGSQARYDLVKFLDDIGKNFSAHTSLTIRTEIHEEGFNHLLNTRQKEHLYHIIKECITNVIKHSGATEVWVRIYFHNDQCCFLVQDNGKGISNKNRQATGIGLKSMQKRMEALNGQAEIGTDNPGTIVQGCFPLT